MLVLLLPSTAYAPYSCFSFLLLLPAPTLCSCLISLLPAPAPCSYSLPTMQVWCSLYSYFGLEVPPPCVSCPTHAGEAGPESGGVLPAKGGAAWPGQDWLGWQVGTNIAQDSKSIEKQYNMLYRSRLQGSHADKCAFTLVGGKEKTQKLETVLNCSV